MSKLSGLSVNVDGEKFSGWSVVLGCFIFSFLAIGLVTGTASLFMEPITSQFNIDTGKYSIIFLVAAITSALGVMWYGPKLQEDSMRRTLIVSVVITGILYFIMGFCSKLWQFIVVWGSLNFVFAGASQIAVATIITSWFNHKRSIALSMAYSGTGFGTAVWSLVWGRLIAQGRWQMCYFIGGGIVALGAALVIYLFIKKDPQSYGEKALRGPDESREKDQETKKEWQGIDRSTAIKTLAFAMIVVIVSCVGWLAAGVATHAVNYLIGIGWSTTQASGVHSLYGLVSIVALLIGGLIFDKLGLKKGTLVSLLFAIVGLISLILAETRIFGYIYAISYGLSVSLPRLMPAMLVSELFGVKDYGSIFGLVNVVFLIGCALGSVLTGVINDLVGYRLVWSILIGLCIITFICVSIALKNGEKIRKEYS